MTYNEVQSIDWIQYKLGKMETWKNMTTYYKNYTDEQFNMTDSLFAKFDLEVVMYDETELLKTNDDHDFKYPWGSRKSLVDSFKVELNEVLKMSDYDFPFNNIHIERSEICLKNNSSFTFFEASPESSEDKDKLNC